MTNFYGLHSFASAQAAHPLTSLRRTGVVVDISGVPDSVLVAIGGDDAANASPMAYLDSYLPNVGDYVLISSANGDNIIEGAISSLTPNYLAGFIEANHAATINLARITWLEASYDTAANGGSAANGQATLSGGSLLIPRTGLWVVQSAVRFPGSDYARTITGTGPSGANFPYEQTQNTMFISAANSHMNVSKAWPVFYTANQTVSGYIWHDASTTQTITAGGLSISAYQVG